MATIFVSSTFKDMQHERDALRDLALPRLNRQARAYGLYYEFCDLRWGVNTSNMSEEEASRKVIDVCLNEIDRSEEPMIVLIGERYGWIPDGQLIANISADRDMALTDLEISCTALEIEFGSFFRKKNTLFYFREITSSSQGQDIPGEYLPEDVVHHRKLNEIKMRIRKLFGERLRFYRLEWSGDSVSEKSIREFASMVESDLVTELEPRWQEYSRLSAGEKAMRSQWGFIRKKASMFCARRQFADEIYIRLTNEENAIVVHGDSGFGKSTLFSYIAQRFDSAGWVVLPFVSGLNEDSVSSLSILRTTIKVLEELLGEVVPEQKDDESHIVDVTRLMHRRDQLCRFVVSSGQKIIVMVDAVDQLTPDNNRDDSIFIPKSLGDDIKFFATTLPGVKIQQLPIVQLSFLPDNEKLNVIDSVLGVHGRELSDEVKESIISMKESGNPMFLSLILQRLMILSKEDFYSIRQMGDDMNAISAMQKSIIETCPDSIQQMAVELIEVVSTRINEPLLKEVFRYMAATRHGLRVSDLSVLLSNIWDTADFIHMTNYLQDCFMIREDGRYDFLHCCFREGLNKKEKPSDFLHARLLVYLNTLPILDPVRMSEYLYHCMKVDAKIDFFKYFGYYTSNILHEKKIIELTYEAARVYARRKGLAEPVMSFSDEKFKEFAFEYGKPFMDNFSKIAKNAMFDCFLTDHGEQLCGELDFLLARNLYDKEALDVIEGFCIQFLDYDLRWAKYATKVHEKIILIREAEYNQAIKTEGEGASELLNRLLESLLAAQITYMNAGDTQGMDRNRKKVGQLSDVVKNELEQGLSTADEKTIAERFSVWANSERPWTLEAQSLLNMGSEAQIAAALLIMEWRFSIEGGFYDVRALMNNQDSSPKEQELYNLPAYTMFGTGNMLFGRYFVIARAHLELAKYKQNIDEKIWELYEAIKVISVSLYMLDNVEGILHNAVSSGTEIPYSFLGYMDNDDVSLLRAEFTLISLGVEFALYRLTQEGSVLEMEQTAMRCFDMFTSAFKSKKINIEVATCAQMEIAYTMRFLCRQDGSLQKEEYWDTRYKNLTSFADNNNVYVSRLIKNLEKYNTFE